MRIRISGDGTPLGTKVFNAESGEEIKGINYLVYEQDANGPARVMLGFELAGVDVTVDNVDTLEQPPTNIGIVGISC